VTTGETVRYEGRESPGIAALRVDGAWYEITREGVLRGHSGSDGNRG
jgi:hypothetical protein